MDLANDGASTVECRVIEHWPAGVHKALVRKRIAGFLNRGVAVLMVVDADRAVIVFRPDGRISVFEEADEPIDRVALPLLGCRIADLLTQPEQ